METITADTDLSEIIDSKTIASNIDADVKPVREALNERINTLKSEQEGNLSQDTVIDGTPYLYDGAGKVITACINARTILNRMFNNIKSQAKQQEEKELQELLKKIEEKIEENNNSINSKKKVIKSYEEIQKPLDSWCALYPTEISQLTKKNEDYEEKKVEVTKRLNEIGVADDDIEHYDSTEEDEAASQEASSSSGSTSTGGSSSSDEDNTYSITQGDKCTITDPNGQEIEATYWASDTEGNNYYAYIDENGYNTVYKQYVNEDGQICTEDTQIPVSMWGAQHAAGGVMFGIETSKDAAADKYHLPENVQQHAHYDVETKTFKDNNGNTVDSNGNPITTGRHGTPEYNWEDLNPIEQEVANTESMTNLPQMVDYGDPNDVNIRNTTGTTQISSDDGFKAIADNPVPVIEINQRVDVSGSTFMSDVLGPGDINKDKGTMYFVYDEPSGKYYELQDGKYVRNGYGYTPEEVSGWLIDSKN